MSAVPQVTLERVCLCLFELEQTIQSVPDQPLNSLIELQQQAKLLEQLVISDGVIADSIVGMSDLLADLIAEERFLTNAAQQTFATWLTEWRSQYLAQVAFYLTPDWGLCRALYNTFVSQCTASVTSSTTTQYRGKCMVALQQGFRELESLSLVGYWRIEQCTYPSSSNAHVENSDLEIQLRSALSLDELASRFTSWYWSRCDFEGVKETVSESKIEHDFSSQVAHWLHILSSERNILRKNSSMFALHKSMQAYLQEVGAAELRELVPGVGEGLQVVANRIGKEKVERALLYGGSVVLLDESFGVLNQLALANTMLPIYRLVVGDEIFVIPSYRVEGGLDLGEVKGLLYYHLGSWQRVPLEIQVGVEYLVVDCMGAKFVVLADEIERDYATVLQTSYLPKGACNLWLGRSQSYIEPSLFEADRELVQCLTELPTSVSYQVHKLAHNWLKIEFNSNIDCFVSSECVYSVLTASDVEILSNDFLLYAGWALPVLENGAINNDVDVVVVLGSPQQMLFALRGKRVQVSQDVPEILLDLSTNMLDWHDSKITMAFVEPGSVLIDRHSIQVFHKQLLEIFI